MIPQRRVYLHKKFAAHARASRPLRKCLTAARKVVSSGCPVVTAASTQSQTEIFSTARKENLHAFEKDSPGSVAGLTRLSRVGLGARRRAAHAPAVRRQRPQ